MLKLRVHPLRGWTYPLPKKGQTAWFTVSEFELGTNAPRYEIGVEVRAMDTFWGHDGLVRVEGVTEVEGVRRRVIGQYYVNRTDPDEFLGILEIQGA